MSDPEQEKELPGPPSRKVALQNSGGETGATLTQQMPGRLDSEEVVITREADARMALFNRQVERHNSLI